MTTKERILTTKLILKINQQRIYAETLGLSYTIITPSPENKKAFDDIKRGE